MDAIHYVYLHEDPLMGDVVYVGTGTGQRAWMMRNSGSGQRYGHRCQDHYNWFKLFESKGYTLADIVKIDGSGLSKEQAKIREVELITELCPIFNKHHNPEFKNNLNKYFKDKAKAMRSTGLSYNKIAKVLGCSTMTAYRNINDAA